MFVTNWISTTKIQKISEITNFFRHYFLSRTEVIGSIPDFRSGGGGSNPSGVYMEFVAQLVECQVVALVVMGSIPIKLPNASIAQW